MCSRFKTSTEPETGTVLLKTRRPAQILYGRLTGSEISRCGHCWKVWTPRVRLASMLAQEHALELWRMDGEAELLVPDSLAGALLPRLGAKVRRHLSPEQKAALVARLQGPRNSPNYAPKALRNALPGAHLPA